MLRLRCIVPEPHPDRISRVSSSTVRCAHSGAAQVVQQVSRQASTVSPSHFRRDEPASSQCRQAQRARSRRPRRRARGGTDASRPGLPVRRRLDRFGTVVGGGGVAVTCENSAILRSDPRRRPVRSAGGDECPCPQPGVARLLGPCVDGVTAEAWVFRRGEWREAWLQPAGSDERLQYVAAEVRQVD